MILTHEILGRELDAIDDVRRQFERFYTQDYDNPYNGDRISDDYWRIVDLSTQPQPLKPEETDKLNRSIARLSARYPYIDTMLGQSVLLLAAYSNVVEQVNAINATDPLRADVKRLIAPSLAEMK